MAHGHLVAEHALTMERQGPGGYKLYTNGKETDEGAMRTVVASLVKSEPQVQAVIAADRGIAYGEVMHVVGLGRHLGHRHMRVSGGEVLGHPAFGRG